MKIYFSGTQPAAPRTSASVAEPSFSRRIRFKATTSSELIVGGGACCVSVASVGAAGACALLPKIRSKFDEYRGE